MLAYEAWDARTSRAHDMERKTIENVSLDLPPYVT